MHRLGAVAVGVEQERAVVVVPVLGTGPGRAVVAVAGGGPDAPELVDVLARGRDERDVQAPGHRGLGARLSQREVVPLGELIVAVRLRDAERAQHRRVEPLRCLAGRGADRDVVEHRRGPGYSG
jgi:hypothetical protein